MGLVLIIMSFLCVTWPGVPTCTNIVPSLLRDRYSWNFPPAANNAVVNVKNTYSRSVILVLSSAPILKYLL